MLRSGEVKVERVEDCIPKDLRFYINFKSNLQICMWYPESSTVYSVVETLDSMPLSQMNMLHSQSQQNTCPVNIIKYKKILYISKISSILKPSQLLSPKEQKLRGCYRFFLAIEHQAL